MKEDRRQHAPSITVRPTAEEKRRFSELAATRGVSEATLALIAIRSLLGSNDPAPVPSEADHGPATDRITIRLRPGDGQLIAARAAKRGLKCSAYLAALIRAHVAANPPLAADELSGLKQAVFILAKLEQLLSRMSLALRHGGCAAAELQDELARTRRAVVLVEQRAHDLAVAALKSWESRYD